jgi:hypothetical protein
MSEVKIIDGTGKQYSGRINKSGQLYVYSESIPSEGAQSERGNSFILHGECHLSANSSGGLMTFTNLEQEYDVEITRIYIDPHTITNTDLIITQVFDAVVSNGADISSTGIVQKNRGSGNVLKASLVISDASSDLTYTGGTQYHAFPVKSMTGLQRNMNSTNILSTNKSITWGFKTVSGSDAVDGQIVSFSVNVIKRLKSNEF